MSSSEIPDDFLSASLAIEALKLCSSTALLHAQAQFHHEKHQVLDKRMMPSSATWLTRALDSIIQTIQSNTTNHHEKQIFRQHFLDPLLMEDKYNEKLELLIIWLMQQLPHDVYFVWEYLKELILSKVRSKSLKLNAMQCFYNILKKQINPEAGKTHILDNLELMHILGDPLVQCIIQNSVKSKDGSIKPTRLASIANDLMLLLALCIAFNGWKTQMERVKTARIAEFMHSLKLCLTQNQAFAEDVAELEELCDFHPPAAHLVDKLGGVLEAIVHSAPLLISQSKLTSPDKVEETLVKYIKTLRDLNQQKVADAAAVRNCLRSVCLLVGRLKNRKLEQFIHAYPQSVDELIELCLGCMDEAGEFGTALLHRLVLERATKTQLSEFQALLLARMDFEGRLIQEMVNFVAEISYMTRDSAMQLLEHLTCANTELQCLNTMATLEHILRLEKYGTSKFWISAGSSAVVKVLVHENEVVASKARELLLVLDDKLVILHILQMVCSCNMPGKNTQALEAALFSLFSQRTGSELDQAFSFLIDFTQHINLVEYNKKNPPLNPAQLRPEGNEVAVDSEQQEIIFKFCERWVKLLPSHCSETLVSVALRKLFASPEEPGLVRILRISIDHLVAQMPLVFSIVAEKLQTQQELSMELLDDESSASVEAVRHLLFVRLSPLLVLKMLSTQQLGRYLHGWKPGMDNTSIYGSASIIYVQLLGRIAEIVEYKEVRTLAADVVAKFPPDTLFSTALGHLVQFLTDNLEASVTSHKALAQLLETRQGTQIVLGQCDISQLPLWIYLLCQLIAEHLQYQGSWLPTLIGVVAQVLHVPCERATESDGMSPLEKVQRGSIDCLAFLLQSFAITVSKVEKHGDSYIVLDYVVEALVFGFVSATTMNALSECDTEFALLCATTGESSLGLQFRICMANVLISACTRLQPEPLQVFTRVLVPRLIESLAGENSSNMEKEIQAAIFKILFTIIFRDGLQPESAESDKVLCQIFELALVRLDTLHEMLRFSSLQVLGALLSRIKDRVTRLSGGKLALLLRKLEALARDKTSNQCQALAQSIVQTFPFPPQPCEL